MDLPRLVYRCPGPHVGPSMATYGAELISTEEEHSAALAAGWFDSLPEAVDAFFAPPPPPTEPAPVDDDVPPTREELEAKAAELGIKVDGRWSDRRLMSELTKALEG